MRAGGNERRLTPRNLEIAKAADSVADELGQSSAQVALAWLRQRQPNIIPIIGARKLTQIEDSMGCTDLTLTDAHMALLNEQSAISMGFPRDFLTNPGVRSVVYGDTEQSVNLPSASLPPR